MSCTYSRLFTRVGRSLNSAVLHDTSINVTFSVLIEIAVSAVRQKTEAGKRQLVTNQLDAYIIYNVYPAADRRAPLT